jgi:hypothetical protein
VTAQYRVTVRVEHHHTFTVTADTAEQAAEQATTALENGSLGEHDIIPGEINRVEIGDTGVDVLWTAQLRRDTDGAVTIGYTASAYPDHGEPEIPDAPWPTVAARIDQHLNRVTA